MRIDKIRDICERLSTISFYLLAAAVTFSNSFVEIATAIIIICWLTRRIIDKDYRLIGSRLTILLGVFVLWNLLSFINTDYMYNSARGLVKVLKYFLLFIATIDYFRSEEKVKKFLLFTLGVCFVSSLNGIVQYIIGVDAIRWRTIDILDRLYRVSSSFRHPNDFGAYLVIVLTILMGLSFSRGRLFKERILLSIVSAPAAFCLFATKSRGAWLAFIAAMLYLAIIKSKRLFVIILLIIIISPFFLPGPVKDRFSDFTTIGEKGGTVWERIMLWKGTLAMVREHPYLGFGVNTYTKVFPKYKPAEYPDVRYTHNSYLQMASEIGIIGSGLFIIFLLSIIISSSRRLRLLNKGLSRDLYLGLFAGIIGFLVHCVVDTHLYSVTLSLLLYLYLGVLVAFRNLTYDKTL